MRTFHKVLYFNAIYKNVRNLAPQLVFFLLETHHFNATINMLQAPKVVLIVPL